MQVQITSLWERVNVAEFDNYRGIVEHDHWRYNVSLAGVLIKKPMDSKEIKKMDFWSDISKRLMMLLELVAPIIRIDRIRVENVKKRDDILVCDHDIMFSLFTNIGTAFWDEYLRFQNVLIQDICAWANKIVSLGKRLRSTESAKKKKIWETHTSRNGHWHKATLVLLPSRSHL